MERAALDAIFINLCLRQRRSWERNRDDFGFPFRLAANGELRRLGKNLPGAREDRWGPARLELDG